MSDLIDTSVFSGYWPFRSLSYRTPERLKSFLQPLGVRQAWVAAAEAILYPDPMLANETLLPAVAGDPFFLPVAIVDVTLATWEGDAQACLNHWGCGALKLVPNYHQYDLGHPRVAELVALAQQACVPVCVQVRMMDERSHHPLMKVPRVPTEEVAALARRHPDARFLVCGAYQGELRALREAPNVWAEIAMVESERSLWGAIDALGPDRVVFASHSPFLYFAAAAAKLDVDPTDVPPEVVELVCSHNAMSLLHASQ